MAQCRRGGRSASAVDFGEINEVRSFRSGAWWISGSLFYSGRDRWNSDCADGSGLVSNAYKTGVEPAGLAVWTGVDGLTVSSLGQFCRSPKFHHLETQPLIE